MSQIQQKNNLNEKISIAPMLDWTDRHFRYFLRHITHHAVFYTEMIAMQAIILGRRDQLLQYDTSEHPLILQVGGSDPRLMAECAKIATDYGFKGINMNAGCPSSRVQAGRFGAILMKTPDLVADCVEAMRLVTPLPISVKTRISLADVGGDGFDQLFRFADRVHLAGCARLIVHARQARLNWTPKDNRGDRLKLDYGVVYRLKKSFPDMPVSINGNILSLTAIETHLKHVDGVMIGRWAYGNPYALIDIDRLFYNDSHPILKRSTILHKMIPYLHDNQSRLSVILPHLAGLFHACPMAKEYRQTLMSRDLTALSVFAKNADSDGF